MKLASKLKAAITKLVNATVENEFAGCGDPDEYESKARRVVTAQASVDRLLEQVGALEPTLEETPQIVKDFAQLSHAEQHLLLTGKKWVNPNC